MGDLIVRKVCRRGESHQNHCEDSLLYIEDERFIHAAVFDGCSTGRDSHFASALFSKFLRKCIHHSFFIDDFTSEITMDQMLKFHSALIDLFFIQLKSIRKIIGLDIDELLSTMIHLVVDKKDNILSIKISGDGCVFIDDERICIESENNAPDYMAYQLNEENPDPKIINIIRNHSDQIGRLIISTDGLTSFNLKDGDTQESLEERLFNDRLIKSEAMFDRKCNMEKNINGITHSDDLSIIMLKRQNQES